MAHIHSFSTEPFALADRYEAWRCRGWPSLAPILDSDQPGKPFAAAIDTLLLAEIPLGYCRITGLDYARDSALIRRDGVDHYGFTFTLNGHYSGDAAGVDFSGGPGTLLVGDFTRPNRMQSSDADCVTVAVPRRLAESVIPDLARQHGLVVSPGRAGLVGDFLLSLRRRASALEPSDLPALQRMLLDLIAMAVDTGTQVEESEDTRLWRARRFVASQLGARDLSSELIAGKLRISRSTLYRLFAPHGGVAHYIRSERLALARRMLEDRTRPLSIAAIAQRCGFADAGQFARSFRAAHGLPPSDWRQRRREPS